MKNTKKKLSQKALHLKRSQASLKGWETRRKEHAKRSRAAKKGWKSRKSGKVTKYVGATRLKGLPRNGVIRYKYIGGKVGDYEVHRKNGKTVAVIIKGKTYTNPSDLYAFDKLMRASERVTGKVSRGNRKGNSRR